MFEDTSAFISNVKIAAEQVGILYILVLVGFIADKTKIFTEKTAKACTDLLFYIVTPAVIINSFFSQSYSADSAKKLLIAVGCGFLIHFAAIIISYPVYKRGDADENAVYKFASIYGNVGYMTLPLTDAILGSEGVFYCSGVVIAFNIISFTHGIYIMDTGKGKFNFKTLLLNPGVLAVAVGLPFYLLNIDLPKIVTAPVAYIDAMQTPLAMIVFGTFLANTNLSSLFKRKKILLAALIKLLMLPAVMFLIYKAFGLGETLMCALMISSCAPSANNTVMFSAKYGKDTSLASQTVALVSFISILTMPLIIAFVTTFS